MLDQCVCLPVKAHVWITRKRGLFKTLLYLCSKRRITRQSARPGFAHLTTKAVVFSRKTFQHSQGFAKYFSFLPLNAMAILILRVFLGPFNFQNATSRCFLQAISFTFFDMNQSQFSIKRWAPALNSNKCNLWIANSKYICWLPLSKKMYGTQSW